MGHLVTRWHQRGALLFPGVCLHASLCVRNINRLGRVAFGDHLSSWPLLVSFLFVGGRLAWEPPCLSSRRSPAATVQSFTHAVAFSLLSFHLFCNSTVSFYVRQGNRPSPLPPSGSKHPPVAFTYCFLGAFFFFFFFRLPPHRPGETATLVCTSCLGPSYTQCSKSWRARAARTLWTLWTLQDKLGGRGRKQLVLGVLLCIPLDAFF